MPVELPGANTLVAAELALDVLGPVPGEDDGGHLVTRYELLRPRVMDTVRAPEVRLQVPGELGIGGEGLLTQLALKLLHVDKLDVVSQGLGHDEAVGTLGIFGVMNSLVMDSELSHVTECFVAGFTLDVPSSGLSDILGDIFAVLLLVLLADHLRLLTDLLVDRVTVELQLVYGGEGHEAITAPEAGPQEAEGRGPGGSSVRELNVQIFVDVPHVRLPVLLSFELAVWTQGAGKPLSGMDSVHVLVPALLLDKFLAKVAKFILLFVI